MRLCFCYFLSLLQAMYTNITTSFNKDVIQCVQNVLDIVSDCMTAANKYCCQSKSNEVEKGPT